MIKKELEDKIKSLTEQLETANKEFQQYWEETVNNQADMFKYIKKLVAERKTLRIILEMDYHEKED